MVLKILQAKLLKVSNDPDFKRSRHWRHKDKLELKTEQREACDVNTSIRQRAYKL